MSADIAPSEVAGRARRGLRLLLVRFGFVQAVALVAGILLARWLGPEPFGELAIASSLLVVPQLLGNLGLGNALIAKRDPVQDVEYSAVLTVQLLAGAAAGVPIVLAGAALEAWIWGSSSASRIVLPVFLATVFLAPLRSVPAVALERRLSFGRLTLIECAEPVVYYGVALGLAWSSPGAEALAYAILARALAGAVLAVALSTYRPRLVLRPRQHLGSLLEFGVAFQTTTIVHHVASLAAPILVGRFGGREALGLVLWAHGNAERPKPLTELVARVAFPSFSRLREAKEQLRAGNDRVLHGSTLVTAAWAGLLGGTAPLLIPLLYTRDWAAGIPYLYVFLALFPVSVLTILNDATLYALERATLVRNLHVLRAVALWAVAAPATWRFGAMGFALAYAGSYVLFAAAGFWVARELVVPLSRVARSILGPLAAGGAVAVASRGVILLAPAGPIATAVLAGLAGGAAFLFVELLLDRERFMRSVRFLLRRD